MLVSGRRVLAPAGLLEPGWVEVEGGKVAAVGAGEPPRTADLAFDDATVSPGLVDVHAHGGGGRSFTEGTVEATQHVVAAHRSHGTTTMVASLVTDTIPELERSVRTLAEAVEDGLLAGLHLEGPWLSPQYAGAHDSVLLRDPAVVDVERLLRAGRGTVRMVTLAPELPGSMEVVRLLVDRGVRAAVGHTDATYACVREALTAGADVGTHLFNAMRGVHHREPGPAAALLEHPDAFIELVADGVHLHPAIVALIARTARGRFLLVTDAMAAAADDDGDYRLGPLEVEVRDRVARVAGTDTIAGSTLTLDRAVRHTVHEAGLGLETALRAATATPARLLRRDDVGVLRPGARADLVVLDRQLEVAAVMHGGEWVRGDG